MQQVIVLDTGPLLRKFSLKTEVLRPSGVRYCVPAAVLLEVKDSKGKEFVQRILPFIDVEDTATAFPDSLAVVEAAAKLTGDLQHLSRTDLEVLALTHGLHTQASNTTRSLDQVAHHLAESKPSQAAHSDAVVVETEFFSPEELPKIAEVLKGDWVTAENYQEKRQQHDEEVALLSAVVHPAKTLLAKKDTLAKNTDREEPGLDFSQTPPVGSVMRPCALETDPSLDQSVYAEDFPALPLYEGPKCSVRPTTGLNSPLHPKEEVKAENGNEAHTESLPTVSPHPESPHTESLPGPSTVLCHSMDFGIQNVAAALGLSIVQDRSHANIRRVRQWVLRCRACKTVFEKALDSPFCPACGYAELHRAQKVVDAATEAATILLPRRRVNLKGSIYKKAAPKSGKDVDRAVLNTPDQIFMGGRLPEFRRKLAARERENALNCGWGNWASNDCAFSGAGSASAALFKEFKIGGGRGNHNSNHWNRYHKGGG